MDLREVRLDDRFDLTKRDVLLSGIQGLARLPMMQQARDAAAGANTAGYVSGYRGSPLGGIDQTLTRAKEFLDRCNIVFQPGLNEDLAATAVWGSQQANLRGEGTYDGVFAMWYGKGPGVDRSGDVFRHANFAGTAELGGVLVAMGDDHVGESSTTLHQSEFALMDAMMPILAPAGVQEVLDYGILGWALSRYCGCWVGIKCLKDTIEATEVVDGDPHRIEVRAPADFKMPQGGLNIRLGDTPQMQEARLHDYKRFAAQAFARENGIDHRVHGRPGAKIGVVSVGKSWLDVAHAFDLLGIDAAKAEAMGISTYKIGMVWPLEAAGLREFAKGLDLLIVVEEKRSLIEVQVKEILFDVPDRPRVIGWKDEKGEVMFSVKMALDPVMIARRLGARFMAENAGDENIGEALRDLDEVEKGQNTRSIVERRPWFCSGCPHNSSTRLPDGSRAYAGIGCHYMVQWMDRDTEGFTHMGGEGANWIGEAPFSTRKHMFQNLGDGTYNHSGALAIRAAIAAGINITYKILYNDAVAMTGGQPNEGGLDAPRIAREVLAMGVACLIAVHDEKEHIQRSQFPTGLEFRERRDMDAVQREMRQVEGVTVILYIQTCAAEKRRRSKRGLFSPPDRRVFINELVCEGCGDCGIKSNCISIVPKETEFGRKREIDQSSCNKDFSCVEGFCPSFVTLHGAKVKKRIAVRFNLPDLPEPEVPELDRVWNLVVTGVGGTGVVTIGALLGMAAHLEGKGTGVMEMAGLAQKGGAVLIHCRLAPRPRDISAIRVSAGEADGVIGGDLVVTGGVKTLGVMTRGRTRVVCNAHEIITGAFTRDADFSLPTERLQLAIQARVGEAASQFFEAAKLAERIMGDAIYANMLMLGAAWQAGLVPLSGAALRKAIEMNGAKVEGNLRAFDIGRWAIAEPARAAEAAAPKVASLEKLDDVIDKRRAFLTDYQNAAYAQRYVDLVEVARKAEAAARPGFTGFTAAAARGAFKLMARKDEYEVARLHHDNLEKLIAERFDGVTKIEFHVAPPILGRTDAQGVAVKSSFGPWLMRAFGALAAMRGLRDTWFDPFGRTEKRRMERRLIAEYAETLGELAAGLRLETHDLAIEIASIPMQIRGFGHVRKAAVEVAAKRRAHLLAAFRAGGANPARTAQ